MNTQQCECADPGRYEWLPEHLTLEHHPLCINAQDARNRDEEGAGCARVAAQMVAIERAQWATVDHPPSVGHRMSPEDIISPQGPQWAPTVLDDPAARIDEFPAGQGGGDVQPVPEFDGQWRYYSAPVPTATGARILRESARDYFTSPVVDLPHFIGPEETRPFSVRLAVFQPTPVFLTYGVVKLGADKNGWLELRLGDGDAPLPVETSGGQVIAWGHWHDIAVTQEWEGDDGKLAVLVDGAPAIGLMLRQIRPNPCGIV